MLMSNKTSRYASLLLDARAGGNTLSPLSGPDALTIEDAYEISKRLLAADIAQGHQPIGRKIGFMNRRLKADHDLPKSSIQMPTWSHIFDSTVRFAEDNRGIQSLVGAVQPRIEPEVIFQLRRTPAPDATLDDIVDCLEWIAHGFEIAVSPYPDWRFSVPDAVAAFGLHGTLIVGEPHMLSAATRRNLAEILTHASLSLSCCTEESVVLCGAGFGSDLIESPVHAILRMHQMLQSQPQFAPLGAGEIITTGSWIRPLPIQAGQTWISAFSGVALQGLTVTFV